MGITDLSLKRLNKYLKPGDSIFILGCQNLYDPEHYGQIAAPYFRSLGHTVKDIDIYECNGAEIADLRTDLQMKPEFDQVWNHGTIEHVDGSIYWPFRNCHDAAKVGGVMIHENPSTGSWPLHGRHYFTDGFYYELAYACNYGLIEVITEASMGNFVDGWNASAVLQKTSDAPFISEIEFNEIYDEHIRKS